MKLWILRPVQNHQLWKPWFDKCFGFVIRAETESHARQLAQEFSIENDHAEIEELEGSHAWVDPMYSSCTELVQDGNYGVIIKDLKSA